MSLIDTLKTIDSLKNLTHNELETVANTIIKKDYPAKHKIIAEGQFNDCLYVIAKGSVNVTKYSVNQSQDEIVSVLFEHDIFGELSWLDGKPHSASIITREDSTILMLPANALDSDIRAKISQNLTIILCQRLRMTNDSLLTYYSLSNFDRLTNLGNRRYFDHIMPKEWDRATRNSYESPLSVIMMDIDNFKAYNDHYGHQLGDKCLKKIAKSLQGSVKRSSDTICRYGGEEFVAVLPNTPHSIALEIAESIRVNIESLQIPHEKSTQHDKIVTLSLGVATTNPSHNRRYRELIREADMALYQAKKLGRNRVVG